MKQGETLLVEIPLVVDMNWNPKRLLITDRRIIYFDAPKIINKAVVSLISWGIFLIIFVLGFILLAWGLSQGIINSASEGTVIMIISGIYGLTSSYISTSYRKSRVLSAIGTINSWVSIVNKSLNLYKLPSNYKNIMHEKVKNISVYVPSKDPNKVTISIDAGWSKLELFSIPINNPDLINEIKNALRTTPLATKLKD